MSASTPLPANRPHTNGQLAAALGYTPWTISMMFRAGCPKDCGSRASLRGVLAWLKTSNFSSQAARLEKPLHPRRGRKRQEPATLPSPQPSDAGAV